jgi:hypothetical protein
MLRPLDLAIDDYLREIAHLMEPVEEMDVAAE